MGLSFSVSCALAFTVYLVSGALSQRPSATLAEPIGPPAAISGDAHLDQCKTPSHGARDRKKGGRGVW